MGRNCHGPKLTWADFVMGRNDPEPLTHIQGQILTEQTQLPLKATAVRKGEKREMTHNIKHSTHIYHSGRKSFADIFYWSNAIFTSVVAAIVLGPLDLHFCAISFNCQRNILRNSVLLIFNGSRGSAVCSIVV